MLRVLQVSVPLCTVLKHVGSWISVPFYLCGVIFHPQKQQITCFKQTALSDCERRLGSEAVRWLQTWQRRSNWNFHELWIWLSSFMQTEEESNWERERERERESERESWLGRCGVQRYGWELWKIIIQPPSISQDTVPLWLTLCLELLPPCLSREKLNSAIFDNTVTHYHKPSLWFALKNRQQLLREKCRASLCSHCVVSSTLALAQKQGHI